MKSSDIFTAIVNEFITNTPEHKKATEFSNLSGINADVVRGYLRGERNIGNKAKRILIGLGVNPLFLETGQGDILLTNVRSLKEPREQMTLPVYRDISCGLPAMIFRDAPVEYQTVDRIKGLKNPIILEAVGESNLPLIRDKDLIVAHEVVKPKDGDIVATNFKSDPETLNANIKIFQPLDKDTFALRPINSYFKISTHTYSEVYSFYKCKRLIRDLY